MLQDQDSLASLLNGIGDAALIHDDAGQLLQCNEAACRRLGYDRDALLAQPLETILRYRPQTASHRGRPRITPGSTEPTHAELFTASGHRVPVRVRAAPVEHGGRPATMLIAHDLSCAGGDVADLCWELDVNAVIARLARALLTKTDVSLDAVSRIILDEARRMTGAAFGYVGFVEAQTGHLVCPTMTHDIWDQCNVPGKSVVFDKFGGLWGWVLEHRQPLLTNNPRDDARSTGTPAGHLPIERFLSAPAIMEDRLLGQVALANPRRDFNQRDLDLVVRLANLYAIAVHRVRSDQTLRENESRLRLMFQGAADGVLILHDTVLDCNDAACRMLGYARDELIGRSPADFSPPTQPDGRSSRQAAWERIHTALSGVPVYFAWQHQRKDGTPVDTEIGLVALEISGQRVLQATIRDITQRKRAEARIGHLNAVLRAIRNVNQVITRVTDRDRLVQAVCDCLTETRGYHSAWLAVLDEQRRTTAMGSAGLDGKAKRLAQCLCQPDRCTCLRRVLADPAAFLVSAQPCGQPDCPLELNCPERGAIFAQLRFGEQLFGILAVSLQADMCQDEEERNLFREVADDVALALHSLAQQDQRRHAERQLQDTERLLAGVLHGAQDAVLALRAERSDTGGIRDLTILLANPAAAALLQQSPDALLGRSISELLPALAASGTLQRLYHVVESGTAQRFELHHDDDGLHGWFQWSASPLEDGLALHLRDVTQRREAENTIRESEDLLRRVLESIPIGVWVAGADFRLRLWNVGQELMTGVSRRDVLGRNIFELFPSLAASGLEEQYRDVVRKGEPLTLVNFRFTDAALAKSDYVLNINANPLKNADGTVVGIVVAVEDISERTRAEQALRQSEQRHRIISSVISDFVYTGTLRPTGLVRQEWLAGAVERITGYPSLELADLPDGWPAIALPDGRRAFIDHVPNLACGESTVIEYQIRTRDGEERWLRDYVTAVGDSTTGSVTGVLGAVQDITFQRTAEQERELLSAQLRRAQKLEAVGQLAGGVAHDFNNILTAILGNSELLRSLLESRSDVDAASFGHLDQIERAAQRAASLTRQMLAFSRRQTIKLEVLQLNQILNEIEKMLLRVLAENIRLELDLAADLRPVRADAGQLEQVIMNLVVNARDAMLAGGHLTITTANEHLDDRFVATHAEVRTGPHVRMTVRDTGTGMTPEVQERLFEPFFTTKPVGQGTGLGLATVYGIVKQLNGHIVAESELGHGSQFHVYLPVADAEPPTVPAALPDIRRLTGHESVLVCEDDPTVRHLAVRFLESAGYNVLAAELGSEARHIAERSAQPIDLLLTDLVIPDTNGRELAESLLATVPGLRVLYMSGYATSTLGEQVPAEEADLVEKPFSRRDLLASVRRVLDRGA